MKKSLFAACLIMMMLSIGCGNRDEDVKTSEPEETVSSDTAAASAEPAAESEPESADESVVVDIKDAAVGDVVEFGSYEQDNDLENGAEPIKWYVLDIKDDEALLLSVDVLDIVPYNTFQIQTESLYGQMYYDWKDTSLRSWLNQDFYQTAFTEAEQERIREHKSESDYYEQQYWVNEEMAASDNVFILDFLEIDIYFKFGSHSCATGDGDNYLYFMREKDERLRARPTAYAAAKGCYSYDGPLTYWREFVGDNTCWWVRSYTVEKEAAIVDPSGDVTELAYGGVDAERTDCGVRPAVCVSLSETDDESVDEERITADFGDVAQGDIVAFGRYEQDNDLENGAEPIEWYVVEVNSGKALLLSVDILECMEYDKDGYINRFRASTELHFPPWPESELHDWMNQDFLEQAFSDRERAAMRTGRIYYEKDYVMYATEDEVFCPGGYDGYMYFSNETAQDGSSFDGGIFVPAKISEYVRANYYFGSHSDYGEWWARRGARWGSAGYFEGGEGEDGIYAGVRPAIVVAIE